MGKIKYGKTTHKARGTFGVVLDAGVIGLCMAASLGYAVWTLSKRETLTAVAHVLIERTDLPMAAELEALRNPMLAKAVIEDLQLADIDGFLAEPETSLSPLVVVKSIASRIGLIAHAPDGIPGLPSVQERWAARVETGIEPHTHILKIVVTLPNPQLAVSIANGLAARYVQSAPESRRLSDLDALRQSVDGLQRKLQNTRETEQMAPPENEKLQARYVAISASLKQGLVYEAAEQLDSEALKLLVEERLKLKTQISIESKTLLDQHPKMIELKDQLVRLEAEIRASVQKAEAALRKATQAARNAQPTPTVTSLAAALGEPPGEIELQLTTAQQKLNTELLKISNGDTSSVSKQQDRIVVAAEMPKISSVWDNIGKSVNSALYGAGIGVGLVLLRRAFPRRTERRRVEIQPKAPRFVSAIAESERNIGEFVKFAATAREAYIAPVVAPALRRTEVAAHLSELLCAGSQAHILLNLGAEPLCEMLSRAVPAVFRNSVCIVDLGGTHFGTSPAGLSDVLAGELALDDAIRQDRRNGFYYISSGSLHRGSFGLELVILTLQDCYDLVVIEGLDVLSDDFETLAPVVTLAVLSDAEEFCEINYLIEQTLLAENCQNILFEAHNDMRISKAA